MTVTTPEPWLRKLMDVHATQGREGNWNHSPYMRGMFNGLELALSIVQNERQPRYKEAPANYISDDRDKAYPDYLSYKRADTQHAQAVTVYSIGINEWDRYQQMVQEVHTALAAFFSPVVMVDTALDTDVPEKIMDELRNTHQPIHVVPRDPMDPALVSEALINWLKGIRDQWEENDPTWRVLDRMLDDARDNAVAGRLPWQATEADDTDAMRVTYPKHGSDTPTAVLPRIACAPTCAEAHTYAEGCVMAMTHPTAAMPQYVTPRPIRDNPQA